jgi:hypothetical protein
LSPPADQLLHDEVAPRALRQLGAEEQLAEVLDVAVQVAADDHIVRIEGDDPAAAAGRPAAGGDGAAEGLNAEFQVGHAGYPGGSLGWCQS